jgi:hypothetical protein
MGKGPLTQANAGVDGVLVDANAGIDGVLVDTNDEEKDGTAREEA